MKKLFVKMICFFFKTLSTSTKKETYAIKYSLIEDIYFIKTEINGAL